MEDNKNHILELTRSITGAAQSSLICVPKYSKYGGFDHYEPIPVEQIARHVYNDGFRKHVGWISVEERFPDKAGFYLVWNKELNVPEIKFFHQLPPEYPVETYPEIRKYFGNCSDHKKISHWMPLPEPPHMKGGAT